MRHARTDHRYQINLEYCGDITRRHVLRFCGQFISQHQTRTDAETARDLHAAERATC